MTPWRLVGVLLSIYAAALLAHAHAQVASATVFEEWRTFDWISFGITLGVAAFGGFVRWLYVLGDDAQPITDKTRQFWIDLVTATIAGGGLYLGIIAYEAYYQTMLPKGVRIPAAIVVGWSRKLFVGWLAQLVGVIGDRLVEFVRTFGRGGKIDGT